MIQRAKNTGLILLFYGIVSIQATQIGWYEHQTTHQSLLLNFSTLCWKNDSNKGHDTVNEQLAQRLGVLQPIASHNKNNYGLCLPRTLRNNEVKQGLYLNNKKYVALLPENSAAIFLFDTKEKKFIATLSLPWTVITDFATSDEKMVLYGGDCYGYEREARPSSDRFKFWKRPPFKSCIVSRKISVVNTPEFATNSHEPLNIYEEQSFSVYQRPTLAGKVFYDSNKKTFYALDDQCRFEVTFHDNDDNKN